MLPDPQDTIVALASAPGPGGRAIVRLSGPAALAVALRVFHTTEEVSPQRRHLYTGGIRLPDVASPLPADLYVWVAPCTYTGQTLTELHTISCPPLLDVLIAECLNAGARAAQPGEFTLRAFLAGKLDLPRAEAVLGVIEAQDRDELKQALRQLAGGVTRPLQDLREDLLNLLADVEAGLDFSDEDIHFTAQDDLLLRLGKGLALVTLLRKQLQERAASEGPFRVVLAGRPNVGKSSLFNALAGDAAALVSPQPGTTRDYLRRRLEVEGVAVDVIDTAGWRPATDAIEERAQALGRAEAERADLLLLCVEATAPELDEEQRSVVQQGRPTVVLVATKCDLAEPPPDILATSAHSGAGLAELRQLLAERARARRQPALAPSLSRCRHHVDACLQHLRLAHAVALHDDPPEILALELRGALEQLGALVGAVYTDDLLDRIFSRFCIGK